MKTEVPDKACRGAETGITKKPELEVFDGTPVLVHHRGKRSKTSQRGTVTALGEGDNPLGKTSTRGSTRCKNQTKYWRPMV